MASALRRLELGRFLRAIDKALFARYVRDTMEVTVAASELGPEWVSRLPEHWQKHLFSDFERVNHMCTEVGRDTLLSKLDDSTLCLIDGEAVYPLRERNPYDVALFAFVCRRRVFDRTYRRFECNRLEGRHRAWGAPEDLIPETIEELADALAHELDRRHRKRGARSRYLVEPLAEGTTWSLLVTYERYEKVVEVFGQGADALRIELERFRPLHRELAVYDVETGALQLKGRGSRRVEVLQSAIGTCLFAAEEHFEPAFDVDLSTLLDMEDRLAEIAEREHLRGITLVRIAGKAGDQIGTHFSVWSKDVYRSIGTSVDVEAPEIQEARFKVDYRWNGKAGTIPVELNTGGRIDLQESCEWPHHEVMEQFVQWGLVQPPASLDAGSS